MPIIYRIEPNYLTDPMSYYPRPLPIYILGSSAMLAAVMSREPDFTANQAYGTMVVLKDIVLAAVLEGSRFEFDNFMSIYPVIRMTLRSPQDLINRLAFDFEMVFSGAVKEQINDEAVFIPVPTIEKAPLIMQAVDAETGIQDFIQNGKGLQISGSNLRVTTGTEGRVYVVREDDTEEDQERLSLNNPSNVIITPTYETGVGPGGAASVERSLFIETRYTPNGSLRNGEYFRKIRSVNNIDSDNKLAFLSGSQAGDVVEVTGHDADIGTMAQIICVKDLGGNLWMYTICLGIQQIPVEITGIDEYTLYLGAVWEISLDVLSYDTLEDNVNAYLGFMNEIVPLGELT